MSIARMLPLVAVLLMTRSAALAQPDVPKDGAKESGTLRITLRGCLVGDSIVVSDVIGAPAGNEDMLVGERFRLVGSRSFLRELKAHVGHEEEVTGEYDVRDLSRANDERVIAEKRFGKLRVYAGDRRAAGPPAPGVRPVELQLESFTHLQDFCRQ